MSRRRIDRPTLAASAAIAVGLALIGWGFATSRTGSDKPLPEAIERVDPVPGAEQVLSQSSLMVDLAPGYQGRLVVDDIELEQVNLDEVVGTAIEPGEQVDLPPYAVFEPGNATITFAPVEGAQIETLERGPHTARVLYWLAAEGRERARSFSWTFNVL